MATPLSEEDPEHAALIEQHQELFGENNDTIERIGEKYNISAARANQSGLILEHLLDYLFPQDTLERLQYDIDYEQTFKERMRKMEVELASRKRKAAEKKLILPAPPLGIVKP